MRTYALNGTAKSQPFWSTELQDSFSPTVQRWKDTWESPGVPGWDQHIYEGKEVYKGEKEGRIRRNELLNSTAAVICVI